MRLVVKQGEKIVNELQFTEGPIHIGRHADSQIFLPDRIVSRHHAVIFSTQDGKWMVEDLDSTNKTYLNDEPIHKAEIKTGDCLRITDFTIEVNLEDDTIAEVPINLDDTLSKTAYGLEDTSSATSHGPRLTIRRLDAEHAPDVKLPAKRIKDFVQATETICKANGPDEVLSALLGVAAKQFSAYHTWCALRNKSTGPFVSHAGKQRDGSAIQLSEIKLNEKITQAVEKCQFQLFSRMPIEFGEERIHSAIIAPIADHTGCFGVLYIDNDMSHECYSLSDLDYAMLLAIHTAAILENF